MAKIYYKGRDYSRAIGGSGGGGGSVDSTDVPTAGKVSEFDNNAHINSEDMSSQDVEDFLADINAQGTPSEYRKLLWSNPSPSSGFAAQTISLDLSDYDEVEIECLASAGGTDFVTERCLIGKATMAQFVSGGNGYGSGTPFLTERRFVTSTTGIIVSTGYGCFTGGSDWSYNSTTRMIPLKIYGIKYEKVAPIQVNASDYVIEQGTSGIWTYRKWESGIAECWGSYSSSVAITSPLGGMYYKTIGNIGFPSGLFVSAPIITATKNGNANGLSFIQIFSVTSAGFTPEVANPSSQTYDLTIAFNAIGRWK